LRGASAIENLLTSNSDPKLRVLVVWEPILSTDFRPPGRSVLARISDKRAKQFWDPEHAVAQELGRIAKERPGGPEPACCVSKGFHWDEAIVYAPGSQWKQMPPAVFWNGPVVREMTGIEKAIHRSDR